MSLINNIIKAFTCNDAVMGYTSASRQAETSATTEKGVRRTIEDPPAKRNSKLSPTKLSFQSATIQDDMDIYESSSVYTAPTVVSSVSASTTHSDITNRHQNTIETAADSHHHDFESRVFCSSDGDKKIKLEDDFWTEEKECMLTLRRANPIYDSDDDISIEGTDDCCRNRGHSYSHPESMWRHKVEHDTTAIQGSDRIPSRVVVPK
eukprot:CAMPEP_0185723994 /NCGR_PEP_ID=MMETSP1171-20130828/627_1 /TAXON_ID=374046 /ORGANISM="Helicotheca tamensis, Strain CCMP826" /LENGTH=206 /DNA_ID=CAMNT_0028391765 /DNA_START=72 /DNA_END=692 /DNA_ORIENTATION=-